MGYGVYNAILLNKKFCRVEFLASMALPKVAKNTQNAWKIVKLRVALQYWIAKLQLETIKVEIADFAIFSH
jgi:hypothetical protein